MQREHAGRAGEATAWRMTRSQPITSWTKNISEAEGRGKKRVDFEGQRGDERGRRLDGEVSWARPCCSRCVHLGGSLNLSRALFDTATTSHRGEVKV